MFLRKWIIMKTALWICLLSSLFIGSGCQGITEFYVSPSGNDLDRGTKEKPFATIQKASEAARTLLDNKQLSNITIYLDGGTYWLEEPILLKPEDSGKENFRVNYSALPGKEPVISGGTRIIGWEKQDKNVWVANIPQVNGKHRRFRELFIDDQRAQRARHPNKGFLRIKEVGSDNRTNFLYNPGDFPLPEHPEETELILLHDWSITRINIKEIDPKENRISAIDSIGAKVLDFFNIGNWEQHPRYYLENSIEFLDQPYEWYFDNRTQNVYLALPEGVDPQAFEIIAPYATGLLSLEGSEGNRIRNITFDGITFSHCAFSLPQLGYAGIQACHFDPREGETTWGSVPSALNTSWAENIMFDNCTLIHLGGSGIRLGVGSLNCSVSNCRISDISGNGIMIGEGSSRLIDGSPWWRSAPGQASSDNQVLDCQISKTGQQFYGAVGIWSGITVRTIIQNNQIWDLPYTGISIGWLWSNEPTPCREIRIADNHIHHIMKMLSDGGGIYTLGLQPEGEITGNHIHHVDLNAGRAESNGMFLDEGTTGLTISNNLIYQIAKSPLRFHKATTNLVKENILGCLENVEPVRYNRTNTADIMMERNRVFSATKKEDMTQLDGIIKEWKANF